MGILWCLFYFILFSKYFITLLYVKWLFYYWKDWVCKSGKKNHKVTLTSIWIGISALLGKQGKNKLTSATFLLELKY